MDGIKFTKVLKMGYKNNTKVLKIAYKNFTKVQKYISNPYK